MASVYAEDYQQVIGMLKKARKDRGVSQVQLSEAFGRPQSFIAKVENGERRLDIVEFLHLARLLDLDPSAVINKIYAKYKPLKL